MVPRMYRRKRGCCVAVDRETHSLGPISSSLAGMRVCIVSPDAYPLLDASVEGAWSGEAGGAEIQLSTIGLALARAGLDVHFVVADCGQAERVEVGGVTAHRATFRYMGGSKKYVLPDWWRLWRILRRIRADYHLIKVPRHLLLLLGLHCRLHGGHLIYIGQKDSDLDESIIRSRIGADYHLIKVPRHLLLLLGLHCRLHGGHLIYIGQKDSDLDESIIRSNE